MSKCAYKLMLSPVITDLAFFEHKGVKLYDFASFSACFLQHKATI